MQLCIRSQGKAGQADGILVRCLDGDLFRPGRLLETELLARRRDARDGLELALELKDCPRRRDATLGSSVLRDDQQRHVRHGVRFEWCESVRSSPLGCLSKGTVLPRFGVCCCVAQTKLL